MLPIAPQGLAGPVGDDLLARVWRRLGDEQKVQQLFYGGGISSPETFLRFMRSPDIAACLVLDEASREPVLIAWLTNIGNRSAFAHYGVLGRPRRAAGLSVLEYWRSFRDPSGEPVIDVLLGITPDTHRLALRVLTIMGFTSLGTVPRYCDTAYDGKRTGGVISFLELNGPSGESCDPSRQPPAA
ncbi:MAG: hypothetical protein ACKOTB_10370 [Planctomycetia bacterium]